MLEDFVCCMVHYVDLSKYYNEPITHVEINRYTYNRLLKNGYRVDNQIFEELPIKINNELKNYRFIIGYDVDAMRRQFEYLKQK